MILKKALNNNVVLAFDDNEEEVVVTGNGISFNVKPGQPIDEQKISQKFVLQTHELNEKLANLLKEIPQEHSEIAEKVFQHAREYLEVELDDYLLLTLMDHIHFAITRHKQNQEIKNGLLWEVKKLYKKEFEVGLYAISLINQKLDIAFAEDEAGFIALHFVNSQVNGNEMAKTIKVTKMIQDVLRIIRTHFSIEFDEDSWNYGRMVTHLRFFAMRVLSKETIRSEDDYLHNQLMKKYPDAFACAKKIETYVRNGYHAEITQEEVVYLTLHIARVTRRDY